MRSEQDEARKRRVTRRREALLEQASCEVESNVPVAPDDVLAAVWLVTRSALAMTGRPIQHVARSQRPGSVRRHVPELL